MFIKKYLLLIASVLAVKGNNKGFDDKGFDNNNINVVIDDKGIHVEDDKGNSVTFDGNDTIIETNRNGTVRVNSTIPDDNRNATVVDDRLSVVNGGSMNVIDKMMIVSLLTLFL